MKEYIVANIQGGFSEDEVVQAFNLSYARYRKDHPSPEAILSDACMAEVRAGKERNVARLAKRYKTTEGQIHRALRNQPNIRIPACPITIRAHRADGLSKEEIAEHMGISLNKVRVALRKKRDASYGVQIRTLLNTGLYTQSELADELGVTQSTISYYAEEDVKKPNRPKLRDSQWQELKEAYRCGATVSDLSRKYNISRPAIYRRLKQ